MNWWQDFKDWFDKNIMPSTTPEKIIEIAKKDKKKMVKILLQYRDCKVKSGVPADVANRVTIAIRSFFNANGCTLPLWWDGWRVMTSEE